MSEKLGSLPKVYFDLSVEANQYELENAKENSVIKEDDGSIIYIDKHYYYNYIRSRDGSDIGYYNPYPTEKYRKFIHPMSRCEIEKYKNRVGIYIKATLADFLWVILFTIVPTLLIYLYQKYNFKIKIQ